MHSIRRLLAPATLAIVATTATAHAQSQLAWDFQHANAPNTTLEPLELIATDGGGAVTLSYTAPLAGGVVEYVAAAFNENGDLRWTWSGTSALLNATLSSDAHGSMTVDDGGRTYVATSQIHDSIVTCIDRDGSVLWTQTIQPPPNGFGLAATAVGARPDGGVYVGAYSAVSTWPTMQVIALDDAGSVDWRYSGLPGAQSHLIGTGTVVGLDVGPFGEVLVYGRSDDVAGLPHLAAALMLMPNGAVSWYELSGTPMSCLEFVAGEISPGGAAFLVRKGQLQGPMSFDDDLSLVRGTPAVGLWLGADLLSLHPNADGTVRDLAVGPNGDVLLALGGVPGVVRFDATVTRLPGWPLPAGGDVVQAIEPLEGGGALVSALRLPDEVLDVRFLPGQSGVAWTGVRPGIEPPRDQAGAGGPTNMEIRRGARGNVFSTNVTPLPGAAPGATRSGIAKRIEGSAIGSSFCTPPPVNSTGVGALLDAVGRSEVSRDNVSLLARRLPVNTFVLFLASTSTGFVPNPGGSQGDLCLGGAIGRFNAPGQLRRSRADGMAYLQLDLDEIPQPMTLVSAAAGETWHFQAWYRDSLGGAPTSNFTDATSVTLQ